MREANNSLAQTIALGVGAQEIQQDAARVGTALRTISMRKLMRHYIVIYNVNSEYAGNSLELLVAS